jgi:protoporphyrinogen oxidase
MKKKVAIIGAGPAGLTAAYQLTLNGYEVHVFEADSSVGGMAKTIQLWDQLVDLGPHRFFSNDKRVNVFWLKIIGNDYAMVNRLTRIYYKKKFYNYPLKFFNILINLGPINSAWCLLSYIKSLLNKKINDNNFENWVINRFGLRLFQIFFKSYSEKLWGIPCEQIDSDFAAQRIKKFSLFEAIKSLIAFSSRDTHKTLVNEFAYPFLGAGQIYKKIEDKLISLGAKIYLNNPVKSIILNKNKHNQIELGSNRINMDFDHVVSSMPITLLLKLINAPENIQSHAKFLKFRNTILVYLEILDGDNFPDQWIYIHSPNLKTGRITNFKNWLPSINKHKKNTILCLEYWCNDEDEIWTTNDQNLIELATREIYETKLVNIKSVKQGKVIRVPKCYPIYSLGYKKHLKPIEDYLSEQKNLIAIGRYGAFKYNNQDHSILMGLLAAENIFLDKKHNLWDINTDYEYHEKSLITATGLKIINNKY